MADLEAAQKHPPLLSGLRGESPRGLRSRPLSPLSLPSNSELSEDEEGSLSTHAANESNSCWQGSGFKAALLVAAVLTAATLGTVRLSEGCGSSGVAPSDAYPHFLVVGDWGRAGEFNQTLVAAAMARKAQSMRTDFVISTGDNFYPSGLLSPADPAFDASFSSIYSQPSLQVPWHAVLGNHDQGEADAPHKPPCGAWDTACYYSPLHELDVGLARRDPRWHCERSYQLSLAGGAVELFFIDTAPMIAEYADVAWRGNRGGLAEQSKEGQLRELEVRLARSAARWKLVVGHHPIRTTHRSFHSWPEMVERLEPLLTRYGVQAYLCGHDHNLQLLHRKGAGYYQITSGAGSKVGPEFTTKKHALFQHGGNGFVAVRLSPSSMEVEFMGVDSEQPLASFSVPVDVGSSRSSTGSLV